MQIAATAHLDCEVWLAINTAYCKRHRSSLTIDACKQNRVISAGNFGDLRCKGCNGLNNQPGEVSDPFKLHLAYPHQGKESDTSEVPEEIEANQISETPEPETELDLDEFSALDDLLLDLDEETLATITNGNSDFCKELQFLLSDDDAPLTAGISEQLQKALTKAAREEKPRRYAVYSGRCPRCAGYIANTRERQDDDVHRCLECGWRTSPDYEWNRRNPALAGLEEVTGGR